MLCSDCNKNAAIIFIEEKDNDGNAVKRGYCAACAQKRGISTISADINNVKSLSDEDIKNMTKQLNSMLDDLAGNLAQQGIDINDPQSTSFRRTKC